MCVLCALDNSIACGVCSIHLTSIHWMVMRVVSGVRMRYCYHSTIWRCSRHCITVFFSFRSLNFNIHPFICNFWVLMNGNRFSYGWAWFIFRCLRSSPAQIIAVCSEGLNVSWEKTGLVPFACSCCVCVSFFLSSLCTFIHHHHPLFGQ